MLSPLGSDWLPCSIKSRVAKFIWNRDHKHGDFAEYSYTSYSYYDVGKEVRQFPSLTSVVSKTHRELLAFPTSTTVEMPTAPNLSILPFHLSARGPFRSGPMPMAMDHPTVLSLRSTLGIPPLRTTSSFRRCALTSHRTHSYPMKSGR